MTQHKETKLIHLHDVPSHEKLPGKKDLNVIVQGYPNQGKTILSTILGEHIQRLGLVKEVSITSDTDIGVFRDITPEDRIEYFRKIGINNIRFSEAHLSTGGYQDLVTERDHDMAIARHHLNIARAIHHKYGMYSV